MQAIIENSRSINQNPFYQKDVNEKLKKHKIQVKSIEQEDKRHPIIEKQKQISCLGLKLKKAKSAAKIFKQKQESTHLKSGNKMLLDKIWHLRSTVDNFNDDKYQYISGSNWTTYKKKAELIKEENKKIGKMFVQQKEEIKDYKKKMKQEIMGYQKLRDQIRKCKYEPKENPKTTKEKRSLSSVKLAKISKEKENVQVQQKHVQNKKVQENQKVQDQVKKEQIQETK